MIPTGEVTLETSDDGEDREPLEQPPVHNRNTDFGVITELGTIRNIDYANGVRILTIVTDSFKFMTFDAECHLGAPYVGMQEWFKFDFNKGDKGTLK